MTEPLEKNVVKNALREHLRTVYHLLESVDYVSKMEEIAAACKDVLMANGKIILCGNGGSAADCQHISAELVGRFRKNRKGIPAIALTVDTSILTALGNDFSFDRVFSRQVEALGNKGDILIALSTSGNSQNVINAVIEAHRHELKVIGLTGQTGGRLADLCDYVVRIPSDDTARIQEAHILTAHILCEMIEESL